MLRDVDKNVPGADYINANYIRVSVRGQLHAWPCKEQTPVFLSPYYEPGAPAGLCLSVDLGRTIDIQGEGL